MKAMTLARYISVVATGIIVLLARLLIPTMLWSPQLFASVATLIVAILWPGVIGAATIPASRNDAANIGSVGPLAALFFGGIFLSVLAIKLSFVSSSAAFAVVALTFGLLIGGALFIRASATHIRDVSEASEISLQTSSIIAVLQSAHEAQEDKAIRRRIEQLMQNVRFGATPHAVGTALFHEVMQLGSDLAGGGDKPYALLTSLESKIVHRQRLLLQARSRV